MTYPIRPTSRPTPIDPSRQTEDAAAADTSPPPPMLPSAEGSLASSSDLGAMITALLLEAAKARREAAGRAREAAIAAEDAAHARKLEAMEDEADARMWAGYLSGGSQVAAGAVCIVGVEEKWADAEGVAKCVEGGGTIGKTIADNVAADRAADVERAEHAAKQAARNVEGAGSESDDAKELLARALDYYAQYVTAREEAEKAALFRA